MSLLNDDFMTESDRIPAKGGAPGSHNRTDREVNGYQAADASRTTAWTPPAQPTAAEQPRAAPQPKEPQGVELLLKLLALGLPAYVGLAVLFLILYLVGSLSAGAAISMCTFLCCLHTSLVFNEYYNESGGGAECITTLGFIGLYSLLPGWPMPVLVLPSIAALPLLWWCRLIQEKHREPATFLILVVVIVQIGLFIAGACRFIGGLWQ